MVMIRRATISLFIFAFGTGAFGTTRTQAALFAPAAGARVPAAVVDDTIIRSRAVLVDAAELLRLRDGDGPVVFNLFDGVSLVGTVERVEQRTVTRSIIYGRIAGEQHGSFTLVAGSEVVVGNIRAGDAEWYQIRYLGDGVHVVHEVDQEHGIHSDDETGDRPPHQSDGTRTDDDGSIIRVLAVYTTDARVLAGGTAAIQGLVDLAVAETNTAYENSVINPQIELAHTQEVSYNESGQPSTDLSRLRDPDDGFIDEVHELRDQYAADLVSLLVSDMSACGVAYLMLNLSHSFESSAFSVVKLSCATGYYSFGHELGHNMGSHHDRDNAGPALYDYSYGYREPGESWRTIMAYAPGTRIQHFSNPDVMYGGQPTGVPITQPDSAHNALSINNAAFTVANFRTLPYPVNDVCTDALEVVDGTYTGSTELAAAGGSSSCGSSSTSPDVWYAYAAQAGGTLAIDTCGSSFDTVLSVHTFCPGTSANELACNDDSCGQQSSVTVDALPGQVYLIRVAGAQGAFGEYVLNIAGPVDLTPPSPDPMVFSFPPAAATTSSITMEAAMAEDAASGPVKYYFEFVDVQTPGGHDSGWQTSPSYTDTGLLINQLYGYNVRARDSVIPVPNETAPSADFIVATHIQTPQSAPVAVMADTTATLATSESFTNLTWGQSGLYFDCLSSDGDAGINEWVQVTSGTATGLTPDTNYTFRFKARNQDAVETDWSLERTRRTKAAVPSAPILSNATCASVDVAIGDDINPEHTTYAIQCTGTSPIDDSWEGMYIDADGHPGSDPTYQTAGGWGGATAQGLAELTGYTFAAQARNAGGITTELGPAATLTTLECSSLYCGDLPDAAVCMGDVNGDGMVDPSDVGLVKFWYGDTDPASLCYYDVNCDGQIDPSDVGLVKFYYGICDAGSDLPCWAE
jgi:hypothetical protein